MRTFEEIWSDLKPTSTNPREVYIVFFRPGKPNNAVLYPLHRDNAISNISAFLELGATLDAAGANEKPFKELLNLVLTNTEAEPY